MNIKNNGIVIGRATKDPKFFTNSDGSKKVMLTVAAQDNFRGRDNKRGTQFVPVEAFVPAGTNGLGVYDHIHAGDLIGVEYSVRSSQYEKNGETVYSIALQVQSVDLMESKATTDARAAKKAEGAPAAAPDELPFE